MAPVCRKIQVYEVAHLSNLPAALGSPFSSQKKRGSTSASASSTFSSLVGCGAPERKAKPLGLEGKFSGEKVGLFFWKVKSID